MRQRAGEAAMQVTNRAGTELVAQMQVGRHRERSLTRDAAWMSTHAWAEDGLGLGRTQWRPRKKIINK